LPAKGRPRPKPTVRLPDRTATAAHANVCYQLQAAERRAHFVTAGGLNMTVRGAAESFAAAVRTIQRWRQRVLAEAVP